MSSFTNFDPSSMEARFRKEVDIAIDGVQLKGDLFIPGQAEAIVIFSHGSGSIRHSFRDRAVDKYP